MTWNDYKSNLLPTTGLVALGAFTIWLSASFTPWLDRLPFSPWWLIVLITGLAVAMLIFALLFEIKWENFDFFVTVAAIIILIASLAANIGFALWFRTWLDGLSFNSWWLAVLFVPVAGATISLVHLYNQEEMEELGFLAVSAISLLLVALLAINIGLSLWLNPWLRGLPFNPWWLLAPVGIISLAFLMLSGWGEIFNWIIDIPVILLVAPPLTLTSPVWGPVVWVYILFRDRLTPYSAEEFDEKEARTKGTATDSPIDDPEDDRFYYQDYVNVLTDLAIEAETPLTIGIFGRWGSGKTSLMRLMKSHFDWFVYWGRRCKTLWINVWQLSNREELWTAFLQSLLTQVHESLPWHRRLRFDWHLFCERVRWSMLVRALLVNSYRIVIAVIPILLSALWPDGKATDANALLAGGGVSFILGLWLLVRPAVQAARKKVSLNLDEILKQAPYEAQVSALQQLQDDFWWLVKTWVGKDGRLIVFIDDLDRCSPDKIPEILEALKLFTTTESCVYVMGVDHDVVCNAVKEKYDVSSAEAAEYLEKIIQIPFNMPPLEDDRMQEYVKGDYPDIVEHCLKAPEIFTLGIENYPRKLKRALNVYRTLCELSDARADAWEIDPIEPELLAKMVVIQSRFQKLYKALVRDPGLLYGLEDWAQVFKGSDNAEQSAEERTEIRELFTRIEITELGRSALAKMLAAGQARFGELERDDLNVYIYLTGTAEYTADRVRPNRKEGEALLGGDVSVIEEKVDEILRRGKNKQDQQKIINAYIERLEGVLSSPKRFESEQRESANIALDKLEKTAPPLDFEPSMVCVPRGTFLMGYTDEDITMLAEVIDNDLYDEILYGLAEDSELEKFTREFVNSVQKEVQGRETVEWSYLGHRRLVDRFFPESARERRTERGEKAERHPGVHVDRFSISRYPVTNTQYHEFVEETRHRQPEHWHDYTDLEYLLELGDYPVVNVSWMDAMAYCEWLSEKTGKKYGLPTEAQWEKAARGVSGQPFPWGNSKDTFMCNTSESGYGAIVSVGENAPLDDSPYLVADMIGNVWEWTSSLYKPYPYEPEDGREDMHKPGPRVLRGGSFIDILWAVCCSARHKADPNLRLKNVGFRVVMFRERGLWGGLSVKNVK